MRGNTTTNHRPSTPSLEIRSTTRLREREREREERGREREREGESERENGDYINLQPTRGLFMKSSTCMEGGRLVFCFLVRNKSRPRPMTRLCCIATTKKIIINDQLLNFYTAPSFNLLCASGPLMIIFFFLLHSNKATPTPHKPHPY